jgi:hypothetical protein
MALTERFEGFTIAAALATRASQDPGTPYLRVADAIVTLGQVETQAEALAASLVNLGIEAGDRVALILPSCPEYVVTLFAVAQIGAVAVPLNPRLTTSELQYMLRHSEAVCAVTIEQSRDTDYLHLFEHLMPQLPDLRYLVTVGEEDLWYDDHIFQFEDLVSATRRYGIPGSCDARVASAAAIVKPSKRSVSAIAPPDGRGFAKANIDGTREGRQKPLAGSWPGPSSAHSFRPERVLRRVSGRPLQATSTSTTVETSTSCVQPTPESTLPSPRRSTYLARPERDFLSADR